MDPFTYIVWVIISFLPPIYSQREQHATKATGLSGLSQVVPSGLSELSVDPLVSPLRFSQVSSVMIYKLSGLCFVGLYRLCGLSLCGSLWSLLVGAL